MPLWLQQRFRLGEVSYDPHLQARVYNHVFEVVEEKDKEDEREAQVGTGAGGTPGGHVGACRQAVMEQQKCKSTFTPRLPGPLLVHARHTASQRGPPAHAPHPPRGTR